MSSGSADLLLETLKKKLLQFKTNVNALNLEYERKQELLKEEKDKRDKAEAEVAALQRRIRLLEDDLESTDTRLTDATAKLEEASKAADESERFRRALQSRQVTDDSRIEQLQQRIQKTAKEAAEAERKYQENRTVADEERISSLEEQLKEFTFMAEDADRKYDEATQKLATAEDALSAAEKRVEDAEDRIRSMEHELRAITTNLKTMELSESTLLGSLLCHGMRKCSLQAFNEWSNWQRRKILDLEDELRIVGNNMKSLEISEQEAAQREEAYEENIRDLTERLKAASKQKQTYQATLEKLTKQLAEAEDRAQDAERLVHTLQSDADRLEGKNSVWNRAWAEKRTERAEEEMTRRQEELTRLEAELDMEKTLNASLREDMESIVAELQNL
ncbi:unnamed protein product [Hymenolepis diminuta]|uniref:Tropomyosin n=1 Tax=Hymenolepis diminuta TaxID=6216 RepID=A0A0R3SWK2_HYMDI|nr:unnamed protein product [Hymenolepis diminuta]